MIIRLRWTNQKLINENTAKYKSSLILNYKVTKQIRKTGEAV